METGFCEPVMGSVAPVVRSLGERIDAVHAAVRELAAQQPPPRSERLFGIHNPWGHASVLADAWRFLDLCEDPAILDRVEQVIGPDIVLWDSELHLEAASYLRFVQEKREGRYWPATPLAGAVVLIAPGHDAEPITCLDLAAIADAPLPALDPRAPLYVIRYMPATSHFARDPRSPANWIAMEEQPLINYATRPLWLARGEDRAGNDFVTGFSPTVPRWAGIQPEEN
jgi:hypothetical protein